jgi:hypothetical protein
MSTKRFFTILILLLIALSTSYATIPAIPVRSKPARTAPPSFVWDTYQPSTFDKILDSSTIALTGSEPNYLSLHLHRSRVNAIYTGENRPVSEARTDLISTWFEANQADRKYKKFFIKEYLFLADGKEYWLPVQAAAYEYMEEDMQDGDNVILLVMLLGARRDHDRLDWLFVVNDILPEQSEPDHTSD